ncbi:MAG: helix-turn-helix domain-containing protein [Acidimicrobiia bacterium]
MARLRKARGLTLDALGERVGRARPNVIKWEAGEAPSPPKLLALARALEVDPWQLTATKPQAAELADLRDWAGLTRRELAAQAGIRRSTYADIERGTAPLRPEVAEALARVLDCDVSRVERAYRRTVRRADSTR